MIHANQDGKVLDVTKKTVTIQYTSKDKSVEPKVEKIQLKEWTTKEESGTTYTHKLIPNVKKGDKLAVGDCIAYDRAFFEPDMFNPKRVIFKSSTNVDVALIEELQTFEDSCSISKKTSNRLTTTVTKVSSIIVNNTDDILGMVQPGTKVEPSTVLFTISDASVSKLTGLDDKTIEALKRLKQFAPKAKYKGTVNKFVIYYNSEYEDLSDSLKSLVDTSNSLLRANTGDNKMTGQVNSGYSIQGKPLGENLVEIKIYIEVVEGMGVADKLIFGNQLKSTVGEVFNYSMKTEDGTEIDAIFGMKSISNRIVNSPFIMGTTAKVLEVLTDKAIETYFSK